MGIGSRLSLTGGLRFGWAPAHCEEGVWCGVKGGYFSRNEEGVIFVGHKVHTEFALEYDEYTLHIRNRLGFFGGLTFCTKAEWVHYHLQYDWGRVDKEDLVLDLYGIGLSFLEAVPVYSWAAMRTGWAVDAYSLSKDLAEWDRMGQPGPLEAPGVWIGISVDAFGALPWFGILGDVGGLVVNVGRGVYWTP